MEIRYFDIHSHLNLKPLISTKEEVIFRMKEKGVGTITVGTDLETSKEAIKISHTNEYFFATVGLHPSEHTEDFDCDMFLELAKDENVVALGETGLDYYRLGDSDKGLGNREDAIERQKEIKKNQKDIFLKHIEIAKKVGKPLMIHARPSKGSMDAYHDVLDILEDENVRANFHFFVGDMDVLGRILKGGHTVSFDGPITFTEEYNEVIQNAPIGSVMVETDAPFAAPVPYRGKTCEPWMVVHVVEAIARIKNMNEEIVRKQLLENVRAFFKISF